MQRDRLTPSDEPFEMKKRSKHECHVQCAAVARRAKVKNPNMAENSEK
jgi:hypothetical protein